MTALPISALPQATLPLDLSEPLAIVQGGETRQVPTSAISSAAKDFVFAEGELIEVVKMSVAEATTAGWSFSESGGELTITDVPTLSSPTHVRVPDFVGGLPVRHVEDSGAGQRFRKPEMSDNLLSVTSLTLTTLGNSTFFNCTSLSKVYLPSLQAIGTWAFGMNTSLIHVDFPKLTTLSDSSFHGCSSLRTVRLVSLANLAEEVFKSCSSLEVLFIGNYINPDDFPHSEFFSGASSSAIVLYKPDAGAPFDPFVFPSTGELNGRPAGPDLQRWVGFVNNFQVPMREGTTFVSGSL